MKKTAAHYEFYRDFFLLEQAEEVTHLLEKSGIPYKLEKSEVLIDEAIVGNSLTPKIVLRLQPIHFQRANEVIKENIKLTPEILEAHYLNQLDARELLEIIEKPDEWSVEDVVVARAILAQRGIPIDEASIHQMQRERLQLLRAGKDVSLAQLLLFYLVIFGVSILFSGYFMLAGLALSWYYWKDMTVDTTGTKFYTYKSSVRQIGKILFWLWLFVGIPLFSLFIPYWYSGIGLSL